MFSRLLKSFGMKDDKVDDAYPLIEILQKITRSSFIWTEKYQ